MGFGAALTCRWLCVDAMVFGLRSVDAAKLADVGLLYLEGRQAAAGQAMKAKHEEIAEEMRRHGDDEEAVRAMLDKMKQSATVEALKFHQMATSTPEGQRAYRERVEAYAMASVVFGGLLKEPLERMTDALPAVELLPVGAPAPETVEPIGPVRLVDCERPESGAGEQAIIREMDEQGEVPLWAIPPNVVEIVGGQAARLAGGRAASLAGFRALAG